MVPGKVEGLHTKLEMFQAKLMMLDQSCRCVGKDDCVPCEVNGRQSTVIHHQAKCWPTQSKILANGARHTKPHENN